ncbi:MAG: polysaccharide biosynthesis protein, partial [Lentimicrobium sp.]|nr:polysaccharide biosynthesis protein [Lentimicrobium sp.]
MINTEQFISSHITFRKESFFEQDLANAGDELHRAIKNKSVLVIGGGGTIGSSFILEVLRFNPAKLFVVDLSENYLTELTRDLRSTYGLTVPADYKTYPINFDDPIFYRILADAGPFDIVA